MEIINIICIIVLFGMLIYRIYKFLTNEEELKMRKDCIEEAQRQLEMYETQYKWSFDLDCTEELKERLRDKDAEKITTYTNMIKLLS